MGNLGANPANLCPLTLLGFLERAATVFSDCPSVVYHDTVFTWSQTHRRCLRLASALVSLGISRGDTVSLLLPNVPAMYEMHFGVPMSGAVLNNINTRLHARTAAVLLRHSGSKLVFVDPASLMLIRDALPATPAGAVLPRPTYLWTLPMFHANGWSFPWGMAMVDATDVCLRRVNAATVYAAMASHGVIHLCGAPVVLNMLANAPEGVRRPLPGKVRIRTAGAPPPAAVIQRTKAIGFEISHGCEWDNFPTSERARLKARQGVRTSSTGKVDIIDRETGSSVPRDGSTMGEIVFRGGCVMLGYLNDDEATKAAIHPRLFQGHDHQAGENISSVDVESVLYSHPTVNEAAVVARPDELRGETPCAFVNLKDDAADTVTATDFTAWCRERMPQYMVPRTVVFRAELPKTSTGKIQKYVLRNLTMEMGPARKGDGRR
ncbi:unnamed protein product [Miscanthus lutarioriparius]|uniref:Uncharacterized protein n=1 Tax=Miscanthus lutarioriparius TaxID=422564 RepID=A0A811S3B3_9POAL|nr:unnamed protein product [Miscanthus lutarioriparius]